MRLPAGPPMVKNHHLRGGSSNTGAHIFFNQTQRHVDAGGHPGRCPDRAVRNEHAVHLNPDLRKTPRKLLRERPVRRCTSPVEYPRLGQRKCANADRCNTPSVLDSLAQEFGQLWARRCRDTGCPYQQSVEGLGVERCRFGRYAKVVAHEAAAFRQNLDIVKRFFGNEVCHVESGERGIAHHLEVGRHD